MGTPLGVDHALALQPRGKRASRVHPRISTSSERGNHPNPGPDPASPHLEGNPAGLLPLSWWSSCRGSSGWTGEPSLSARNLSLAFTSY